MPVPDARGLLATPVAMSKCFEGWSGASEGFTDGDTLTPDGQAVADRTLLEVLRVREILGCEEIARYQSLTLVAAALAALGSGGPIPDGEVAAAAAGVLEALHAAELVANVA